MIVALTNAEALIAWHVAAMRQADNVRRGTSPKHGAPRGSGGDAANVLGAKAEMAVAKALGVYWSGALGDYAAADVGGYEVRAVEEQLRRLIIHPSDVERRADRPFISVVFDRETGLRAHLRGWIYASDAARPEWWQDPTGQGRHAYFVPNDALRSMADLPSAAKMPGVAA
jgi:hypothetical protein